MFGIGGFELFIILVFGFLIFGPDKLPEIAKTVGRGIARFREAQQEMNDTLGGEQLFDPNNPDEPFKDPVEVLDRIAQKQEEKRAAKANAANVARAGAGAGAVAAASSASNVGAGSSQADVASSASGSVAGADGGGVSQLAASASSVSRTPASDEAPHRESFTERKARYERERAARKAAEKAGVEQGGAGGAGGASGADVTSVASGEAAGDGLQSPAVMPTAAMEETPSKNDLPTAVNQAAEGCEGGDA